MNKQNSFNFKYHLVLLIIQLVNIPDPNKYKQIQKI